MSQINRVLFIGSKRLGLKVVQQVYSLDRKALMGIMTLDDRDDIRSVYGEFLSFASEANVALFVVKNRKEFEEIIHEVKPELCLVAGWYWLVRKSVLEIVKNGFIGIHNSLLPKYRGFSPLVWAIINGESRVGVSLFSFDEGIDNGYIWDQSEVEIKNTDFVSDVLDKLEAETLSLIVDKYLKILDGTAKPTAQDHSGATYCAQRLPSDGWIDWNKSAGQIYNFIRAQSDPYPGAFTCYNGRKLTIWRARPLDVVYYGSPGQVAKISNDGVYIICGDQKPLILEAVQLGAQSRVPAKEILRSIQTRLSIIRPEDF